MTVFNVWQQLCGTEDVASLLGRFDELQQHLSSSGLSSKTLRCNYFWTLRQALQIPQELAGGERQVQQLMGRIKAAVVEIKGGHEEANSAARATGRRCFSAAGRAFAQEAAQQQTAAGAAAAAEAAAAAAAEAGYDH
ncbi:hypothetical protein OEZ86_001006 [Tetradesmus obliquus]|nr:hypothetical protein OEZ86_001006 [Tetradesmus obliquus]